MWVYNKDGSFRVVENLKDKNEVVVRSREMQGLLKADRYIHGGTERVSDTRHADYPYRFVCTKREWADYMHKSCEEIDYSNFKDAMLRHDPSRLDMLMAVYFATLYGKY